MNKPFIVCEMGSSHNGSLETAIKIIDAAKECGANAVKIQVFKPNEMAIPGYVIEDGPWKGRGLRALYEKAYLPWKWVPKLFKHAKLLDIELFATPFSQADVDFLEGLGCPRYKIASFEIVDLELIRYVAKTGKPMIISTGMASDEEVWDAYDKTSRQETYTFLHCISAYPASIEDSNLTRLIGLNEAFPSVGISDHSPGSTIPIAAVALGAQVIEKHLTLTKHTGEGLDDGFAMSPSEFKEMVKACRQTYQAMQPPQWETSSKKLRRSLYYAEDLPAGTMVLDYHLITRRPALGLCPTRIGEIIGTTLKKDVKRYDPVSLLS